MSSRRNKRKIRGKLLAILALICVCLFNLLRRKETMRPIWIYVYGHLLLGLVTEDLFFYISSQHKIAYLCGV